jgi:hypothetical protein
VYATCQSAAELAETAAEESPGAALLLAVLAVVVWSRSGVDLYGDYSKKLHEGWSDIAANERIDLDWHGEAAQTSLALLWFCDATA